MPCRLSFAQSNQLCLKLDGRGLHCLFQNGSPSSGIHEVSPDELEILRAGADEQNVLATCPQLCNVGEDAPGYSRRIDLSIRATGDRGLSSWIDAIGAST